jgi:short-subunit dehydrogenase
MILVARREDRLAELRDELQQQHPNVRIRLRNVDLADLVQLKQFMEWLDRESIDVDVLVNNAGLGDSGVFAISDPIRNEQMTLVNVVALTSLTRHILPQMITKHRGGILNVSSSAGFLSMPGSAVYAATKGYVTSFSEALRAELHGTGISVCALCPGPVRTEFQQVARRPDERQEIAPEFVLVPVEQVVGDAIKALEADKPIVIPGFAMKLAMLLARLTPMPLLRLLLRRYSSRDSTV